MSKVVQYRGKLTTPQIHSGIEAAQKNAERLLEDARALFALKRYPSAAALAILSIEESGKVSILKRMALVIEDEKLLKSAWTDYRQHRPKNAHWIMLELALRGARKMTEFAAVADAEGEHAYMLDTYKQLAFYSDCLGTKPSWSQPNNAVDEEATSALIVVAARCWCKEPVQLRELELWQEHVAPHYDKPSMMQAVVGYQAAMHAEGLSDTTPEELADFMGATPPTSESR